MGKNKMIAKSCPKCEMQVAVASKSCKCGHTFFAARRGADHLARIGDTGGGDDLRRRTARVRRSQTQFYDASYQKKRRSPKKRSLSETHDESYKGKEKESATARARRRRALRRAQRETPQGQGGQNGGDVTPVLKPKQLQRCQLILQEINRKMQAVTWQPPAEC
ncbi:hypothetical protein NE865_08145 [Phthorimaea operculella]|nr:hypothetical protein NE865_08145 [Phthorimaea operculella]